MFPLTFKKHIYCYLFLTYHAGLWIIKLAIIVTISYRTKLQLKWNGSDPCHVSGSLCPP